MGNTNNSLYDPEIRALVHEVNSHLHSKSSLLYQISQLKQKINSRKAYVDNSEEISGSCPEIEEIRLLIEKLNDLAEKNLNSSKPNIDLESINDFSELFSSKDKKIFEISQIKEQEIENIKALNEKKLFLEQSYNDNLQKIRELENPDFNLDYKQIYMDLHQETENLGKIAEEFQSKIRFLSNKKTEYLRKRLQKRKTIIGLNIENSAAMNLRSKYILKNEIIKTINETSAEQELRLSNLQKNPFEFEKKVESQEEESLMQQLGFYRDQILELE